MRTLPTVTHPYNYPKLTFVGTAIYALLVCIMAIYSANIGSAAYLISLITALSVGALLPIGAFCSCLFFTIPFTAILKLPIEAFSFITLMQLILVFRALLDTKGIKLKNVLYITVISALTQIFPLLFFAQTVNNIILLIFNILALYSTYRITSCGKLNINHSYLSFAIGVVLAGLISIRYNISVTEFQEFRFSGLWTDPNFWGMFCLIGILTSLLIGFRQPVLFLYLLPIILLLAYQGFLTLSRTFVVICSLMVMATSWSYAKKSSWGSLIVICILAVGVYYALPYAIEIFTKRGFNEADMSNGRFESSMLYLDFVLNNLVALIIGVGYNNGLNFNHIYNISSVATHNSYVDILLNFGLIILVPVCGVFAAHSKRIKLFFKNILSMPGLIICILLFYMATLSMLKYSFLFLYIGTYCGYIKAKS